MYDIQVERQVINQLAAAHERLLIRKGDKVSIVADNHTDYMTRVDSGQADQQVEPRIR